MRPALRCHGTRMTPIITSNSSPQIYNHRLPLLGDSRKRASILDVRNRERAFSSCAKRAGTIYLQHEYSSWDNFGPICVSVMKPEPSFSRKSFGNNRFESGDAFLSVGNASVGFKIIAHLMEILTDKK
jgi:hypothetical protein